MENHEIAKILKLTAKLSELHGVNEFKVRSLLNAAFRIERITLPVESIPAHLLANMDGIGKGTSTKIRQIIDSNSLPELDELLKQTPPGVVQMMNIKGIGPKKAGILWKELKVESPGELLYACTENRLVDLKGFGKKTQEQILRAIEFTISNTGLFHYAVVIEPAAAMMKIISEASICSDISLTGDIRRKCEIINGIDVIVGVKDNVKFFKELSGLGIFDKDEPGKKNNTFILPEGIPVRIITCDPDKFAITLLETTGNDLHLDQLRKIKNYSGVTANSETLIYESLNLPFIEPEFREGNDEIEAASKGILSGVIDYSDLKGILHNHSTYSDGLNTLEEMAVACKDAGYEYFGICDHSKSAFYANGMNVDRIMEQHSEINELNKKMSPFRIFKGIESDILPDGSLDYENTTLENFDFVVASIHSGLKMSEEKATSRLITAIRNPYTTILGHPTGRLLLAREGYPIDHKAVIEECAANGVIIELNANPYRLDMDWRWIQFAISKGVMISINPDAHQVSRLHDMYFGTCAARKGMLPQNMTFNALSLPEVEKHFSARRERRSNKIPVRTS